MEKEEITRQKEQFEIRELLQHEGFKIALKKLMLRINELDTVRTVDSNQDVRKIGIKQLANKLAIEIIELWLDELLGIKNAPEWSERQMEEEDNIIKRVIE